MCRKIFRQAVSVLFVAAIMLFAAVTHAENPENQKIEEGWQLCEQKNFDGAKNLFDEAIKLNPDNAKAYIGRGVAYRNLKQYDSATRAGNSRFRQGDCD